jgi:hypothetical protein
MDKKKIRQAQSLEHCRKEGRNEGSVPFAVHLGETKLQTRMFRVAKTFDYAQPQIVNLKPLLHLAKPHITAEKRVA